MPTTYYCDGVNGNDSNDGLTWGTAKQSVDAALALVATSAFHIVKFRNACTLASPYGINTRTIRIEGDDGGANAPAIHATTILANSWGQNLYYYNLSLSGGANNWLASPAAVIDCDVLVDRVTYTGPAATNANTFANVRFNGTSNVTQWLQINSGFVRDCVFRNCSVYYGFTPPIDRCKYDNCAVYVAAGRLAHCSFWDTDVTFTTNGNIEFAYCVFGSSTGGRDTPKPNTIYAAIAIRVLECWQYNCVSTSLDYNSGNVYLSKDKSYSALSTAPFVNPTGDNWLPSAELAAVEASDGLTPGAMQAAASGGLLRHPGMSGGFSG